MYTFLECQEKKMVILKLEYYTILLCHYIIFSRQICLYMQEESLVISVLDILVSVYLSNISITLKCSCEKYNLVHAKYELRKGIFAYENCRQHDKPLINVS